MVFRFSKEDGLSGFIPGYNVRTDLALEVHEVLSAREELPGVEVEKEGDQDIVINRVAITTEQGARSMGKAWELHYPGCSGPAEKEYRFAG